MGIFYYWIDFVINLMEVCIHKGLKVSSELKEVVLFCNEFVQYQKITPKKGLNFEELLNQQEEMIIMITKSFKTKELLGVSILKETGEDFRQRTSPRKNNTTIFS